MSLTGCHITNHSGNGAVVKGVAPLTIPGPLHQEPMKKEKVK